MELDDHKAKRKLAKSHDHARESLRREYLHRRKRREPQLVERSLFAFAGEGERDEERQRKKHQNRQEARYHEPAGIVVGVEPAANLKTGGSRRNATAKNLLRIPDGGVCTRGVASVGDDLS